MSTLSSLTTHLDLVTSCGRPLLRVVVHLVREQTMQEAIFTRFDEIQDILHQSVLVLVGHPWDIVQHVAGVVLDHELVSSCFKVGVRSKGIATLDEGVVSGGRIGMSSCRRVVQGRKDTSRPLLLDQSTHNSIVED